LPSAWAILLWNEIVEYTSKDATKIMWVTWVLTSHKAWDSATILYKCPTDFWKTSDVFSFIDKNKQVLEYKDVNGQLRKYYETLENWANKYIYFYWVTKDDKYYIEYTKTYTLLEDDVDESIFPDYISLNIIPFVVWGRMIKDEILRVKLLYQWYNKITTETIKQWESVGKPKTIQWKRYNFSSIA
jgi:hypothetical protein